MENNTFFGLTRVLNLTFRNRGNSKFKCKENSILSDCHYENMARTRNHRESTCTA